MLNVTDGTTYENCTYTGFKDGNALLEFYGTAREDLVVRCVLVSERPSGFAGCCTCGRRSTALSGALLQWPYFTVTVGFAIMFFVMTLVMLRLIRHRDR